METKKYNLQKRAKYKLAFGLLALSAGIILQLINPGYQLGRVLLANALIIAGIISLFLSIKYSFYKKEIKYDERDQMIILEASKKTFAFLIWGLICLMLIGTFQIIKVDLEYISVAILFSIIFIYKFNYWIISKRK